MDMFVYSGSMTAPSAFFPDARGEGIVIWRWHDPAGLLERVGTVTDVVNPSWLAIDAVRHRLYAASELHGSPDGRISRFDIDPQTGRLTLVDTIESGGSATCHLAVSDDGAHLAWTNYGTLPLGVVPDASIGLCRTSLPPGGLRTHRHPGRTASESGRQERRHAHCAFFDTARSRLLTTDLGLDTLFSLPLDGDTDATPEPVHVFPRGSGPRHIAALPDLEVFYVVHELTPRIDVLAVAGARFECVQSMNIGDPGTAHPAGIALAPDARHLFVTVRGANEIRGFEVRPDGQLALPQICMPTADTPRDLSFTSDGRHLMVAGQGSGEIRACRFDSASGRLTDDRVIARTGSPTCVRSFQPNRNQSQWPI